jgi:hypothetical protein
MIKNHHKNTSYETNILAVDEALELTADNIHYLIINCPEYVALTFEEQALESRLIVVKCEMKAHSAKMANEKHQMNFLSELFDETPETRNAA